MKRTLKQINEIFETVVARRIAEGFTLFPESQGKSALGFRYTILQKGDEFVCVWLLRDACQVADSWKHTETRTVSARLYKSPEPLKSFVKFPYLWINEGDVLYERTFFKKLGGRIFTDNKSELDGWFEQFARRARKNERVWEKFLKA